MDYVIMGGAFAIACAGWSYCWLELRDMRSLKSSFARDYGPNGLAQCSRCQLAGSAHIGNTSGLGVPGRRHSLGEFHRGFSLIWGGKTLSPQFS